MLTIMLVAVVTCLDAAILSAGSDTISTPNLSNWPGDDVTSIVSNEEAQPLVQLHQVRSEASKAGFIGHGQRFSMDSDLFPSALNSGSNYYSGNIVFGRTRLRTERYLVLSDPVLVTVQGSLDQSIVSDFPTNTAIYDGLSDRPQMHGRVAFNLGIAPSRELSWTWQIASAFDFAEGIPSSLHVPLEQDVCFETSSIFIDLLIPLGERSSFGGHYRTGISLNGLFEDIGQDVWLRLPSPAVSNSAWCEVKSDWTPRCHSRLAVGIDNPVNGNGALGHGAFLLTSLNIDLTDRLMTGFQVAWSDHGADALVSERSEVVAITCQVQYNL